MALLRYVKTIVKSSNMRDCYLLDLRHNLLSPKYKWAIQLFRFCPHNTSEYMTVALLDSLSKMRSFGF